METKLSSNKNPENLLYMKIITDTNLLSIPETIKCNLKISTIKEISVNHI